MDRTYYYYSSKHLRSMDRLEHADGLDIAHGRKIAKIVAVLSNHHPAYHASTGLLVVSHRLGCSNLTLPSIPSKTFLLKFFHDGYNPISIIDILISDVIEACYATDPIYYRELPFIVFYNQPTLKTMGATGRITLR